MSKEYSLPPVGLFKAPGTGIVLSSLTAPLSATPSLSPLSSPHAALFPTGSRTAVTTTAKDVGLHTASAPAAQCAEFIIGPAKGRTRWLTAPYGPAVTEQGECVGPARADLPTTRGDRARERTPRASPGRVLPTTAVPPWVRDTRARAA